MGLSARSRLLLLLVVLSAVLVFATVSPGIEGDPVEPKRPEDVRLVEPASNGSEHLWPYTSRTRAFEGATLPINVVVRSEAATVRQVLVASGASPGSALYWNATAEQWEAHQTDGEAVVINGTGVQWGKSPGAARYTYVRTDGQERWMDATYQLHDGAYFGTRHHLRLYEGGTDAHRWTAVQAHHEYWDWFRLRHNVDSLATARHHVERDFMGTGLLADISRKRYANGGALDADGWVTVIDLNELVTRGPKPQSLTPLWAVLPGIGLWVLIFGTGRISRSLADARTAFRHGVGGTRISRHHLALFVATALLPLVVRVGAITAERALPHTSPVVVGGPFYLLLVVGLPVCALVFGRLLPTDDAFAAAVLGMGTGLMIDYAYLGIVTLRYGAVVQRFVLLFGLGLIAAGGTRWAATSLVRHHYRIVGLVVWVGALLWPLLGLG